MKLELIKDMKLDGTGYYHIKVDGNSEKAFQIDENGEKEAKKYYALVKDNLSKGLPCKEIILSDEINPPTHEPETQS